MESSQKRGRTKCEIYSRVCGYLRPVNQWNIGKQEEFKERVPFKIGGGQNDFRKNSPKRGEKNEVIQEELEKPKG